MGNVKEKFLFFIFFAAVQGRPIRTIHRWAADLLYLLLFLLAGGASVGAHIAAVWRIQVNNN